MDILNSFTWDWKQIIVDLLRITIAFVLAFPIVAVASCGYLLIAKHTPGADADTQARILQGVLSGIGFIGGGAILKEGGGVRGLAIAASIWNTGAIGAAVAFEGEEIAVVLSLINFFLLRFLTPMVMKPSDQNHEGKH